MRCGHSHSSFKATSLKSIALQQSKIQTGGQSSIPPPPRGIDINGLLSPALAPSCLLERGSPLAFDGVMLAPWACLCWLSRAVLHQVKYVFQEDVRTPKKEIVSVVGFRLYQPILLLLYIYIYIYIYILHRPRPAAAAIFPNVKMVACRMICGSCHSFGLVEFTGGPAVRERGLTDDASHKMSRNDQLLCNAICQVLALVAHGHVNETGSFWERMVFKGTDLSRTMRGPLPGLNTQPTAVIRACHKRGDYM